MKEELVKLSSNPQEGNLKYESIHSQVNFLRGKVLTIIEAVISDQKQRKATKDIIHNVFDTQISHIADISGWRDSGEKQDNSK